jgi:fumarate hydratase subunit alpha
MRQIDVSEISAKIRAAVVEINVHTPEPVMIQLNDILTSEPSPAGRMAMQDIVQNRAVASSRAMPMCQDTGMVVIFLEVGQEIHFIGGDLREAIIEGVREGYADGYLRKSVVEEPLFERNNTGDNSPPVIHFTLVPGDGFAMTIAAKGFGAENMSWATVLTPAQGIEGVKAAVVQCVVDAGPNACPPVTVGVGVGGTLEMATILAKKALMRDVGERHPDARYAALEAELLDLVNATGIGPQGWGGVNTAADVRIEYYPTHIAGIPIAINLDCHLQRHTRIEL